MERNAGLRSSGREHRIMDQCEGRQYETIGCLVSHENFTFLHLSGCVHLLCSFSGRVLHPLSIPRGRGEHGGQIRRGPYRYFFLSFFCRGLASLSSVDEVAPRHRRSRTRRKRRRGHDRASPPGSSAAYFLRSASVWRAHVRCLPHYVVGHAV